MIDFPITGLLDASICMIWLERHLHPEGFACPQCGSTNRRLFRQQKYFPAYHCRDCDGYYTFHSSGLAPERRTSLHPEGTRSVNMPGTLWVKRTCHELIDENIPVGSTMLYTDEANSYPGCHPTHGTVCHSAGEWARDDDGEGIREVHCNTCEGAGTALRTYLRVFRGVHKAYLHLYVATYEALLNTKQVTATHIRRLCFGGPAAGINDT